MSFRKAERKNAKLRLALSGTSGSGKSYSSLIIAKEFGSKIAVLDSERGSASLYARNNEERESTPEEIRAGKGKFDFDVSELEEKNVQEYLTKVQEAAAGGYEVLVIDSYSHSWIGALETVDKMGGSKFSNGWKVVSPLVTKLVDAILSFPGHVIATMRTKAEYAIEMQNGKAIPKKLGMATVARDGTDYEFTVMLDLSGEGGVNVSKTRCSALASGVFTRDDIPKIAKTLKAWLSEGAPVAPRDAMAERIRFAADDAAVQALYPEIGKMSGEDRAFLKPLILARKAEFQGVAP